MKTRTTKNIHGFTLLEVMIALVIFSVGLLGLAGLQSRGLQSNTVAQFRTLAIIEAYDMADRIRANPVGIADGNYDNLDSATPVAGSDCLNATCTPQQIADLDYFEWINQIQQSLPSGHGIVTGNGAGSQFMQRRPQRGSEVLYPGIPAVRMRMSPLYRQRGITIVELMIALVVSSIILIGVATVYTSSKRAYKIQEEMSRLQENARFGFEFMVRDIRMAHPTPCSTFKAAWAGSSTQHRPRPPAPTIPLLA